MNPTMMIDKNGKIIITTVSIADNCKITILVGDSNDAEQFAQREKDRQIIRILGDKALNDIS